MLRSLNCSTPISSGKSNLSRLVIKRMSLGLVNRYKRPTSCHAFPVVPEACFLSHKTGQTVNLLSNKLRLSYTEKNKGREIFYWIIWRIGFLLCFMDNALNRIIIFPSRSESNKILQESNLIKFLNWNSRITELCT